VNLPSLTLRSAASTFFINFVWIFSSGGNNSSLIISSTSVRISYLNSFFNINFNSSRFAIAPIKINKI